jgi:hypothetical protein
MRVTLTALLMVLLSASAFGKVNEPVDIDGDWTLEKVSCDDGSTGQIRYDSVSLTISGELISTVLNKDGCEISLEGTALQKDTILTAEFSSGSWTACSGAMPTYVLSRFEFNRDETHLHLSSSDLTPFGSCPAKNGTLHFTNE